MRQVSGRDTWTAVTYGELGVGQANVHRRTRRTELRRVIQQVADRTADPLGIAEGDAWLELCLEHCPRPVPPGHLQVGGDYLVQRHLVVGAGW